MTLFTSIRKTLALILALLLIVLYLPLNGYAETTVYRWDGTNNTRGEAVKLQPNDSLETQLFRIQEFIGGSLAGSYIEAYCIDTNTSIRADKSYVADFLENVSYFSDANAEKIRAIIFGSYPKVDLSV